ncbi:MAG: hypothetical protein WDO74_31515 [Pseudomonadota bacterium]
MTDPERLSRNSERTLAALLLRAGAEEKPSAAALGRTTEAVAAAAVATVAATVAGNAVSGLAGGTSAATGSSAAFKGATLGIGAVAKWIAIGALGGALALSSLQALIAEQGAQHAQAVPNPGSHALTSEPKPTIDGSGSNLPETGCFRRFERG